MRIIGWLSLVWLLAVAVPVAQTVAPQPVGTMPQVMKSLVYPAANALLLAIARGGPTTDQEWAAVERSAVLLGESGNVLMLRGHARDQGAWMTEAKALVDVGTAAAKAASAKDGAALAAVGAPLNATCVTCHTQYRPNVHPKP